jgi:hypothetical protein
MTDAQRAALVVEVTRALEQRGVEREGVELKFRCFYPDRHEHGDAHWSASFNPMKATWLCRVCGAKGGVLDLADRLGVARPPRDDGPPPRLEDFARVRCLTLDTLHRFGIRPVVEFGRPALRYPTSVRIDRLKFLDARKPKYRWATKGGRVHWYGRKAALAVLRKGARTLYIVNGEVGVWACAQAGIAAICPCGGEGVRPTPAMVWALVDAAINGKREIAVRILFDADAAGRAGAHTFLRSLRSIGGDIKALDLTTTLPDVAGGDVDDLHRRVGDAGLAAALAALPVLGDTGPGDDAQGGGGNVPTASIAPTTATSALGPWTRAVTAAAFLAGDDPTLDWLIPRVLAPAHSPTSSAPAASARRTSPMRTPSRLRGSVTRSCSSIAITQSGRSGAGCAPGVPPTSRRSRS